MYILSQWLFLKMLALVYLSAFWSLQGQVRGLFGRKGIVPAGEMLTASRWRGNIRFLESPTLFWLNQSDTFMVGVARAGMVIALLLLMGIAPVLMLALLWFLYLSFFTIGSLFLSYQWDVLLLEVGFASIFFAMATPPLGVWIVLMWFILFRLMFSSGVVKLRSCCPAWKGRTAMEYHYETQPLPTPPAYYAHQFSKRFHSLCTSAVLFIEIVLPFFLFAPAPLSTIALSAIVLLQLLIMLTGNYAFFNLLSLALCCLFIEDSQLAWLLGRPSSLPQQEPSLLLQLLLWPLGLFLIYLNALQLAGLFVSLGRLRRIFRYIAPFYISGSYGLFACMTTVRDELIVEGSNDGKTWHAYEFKWKPGDPFTAPRFVAPHQPRLDWQMWFAALGTIQDNPWLTRFLVCLLEGSEEVLALLKYNPFPDQPPRFMRVRRCGYHFSDLKTVGNSDEWWTSTDKGMYTPVFNLGSVQQ